MVAWAYLATAAVIAAVPTWADSIFCRTSSACNLATVGNGRSGGVSLPGKAAGSWLKGGFSDHPFPGYSCPKQGPVTDQM
jgi:hypothetical protein